MANRNWRVTANFHRVGELVVIVSAPNWQGGLRKAALAIKKLPEMQGRRMKAGAFTIVETLDAPTTVAAEQLPLQPEQREAMARVEAAVEQGTPLPTTPPSEEQG